MSLSKTIKNAVGSAFNAVSDLAQFGTYYATTATGAYDDATDAVVETVSIKTNVKMIKSSVRQTELDPELRGFIDAKILIASKGFDIKPTIDDRVDYGGETFLVKSVRTVPGESLWTLFVRKG